MTDEKLIEEAREFCTEPQWHNFACDVRYRLEEQDGAKLLIEMLAAFAQQHAASLREKVVYCDNCGGRLRIEEEKA